MTADEFERAPDLTPQELLESYRRYLREREPFIDLRRVTEPHAPQPAPEAD